MPDPQSTPSLDGVTLETMINQLLEHYGWEELGRKVMIKCFRENPSVQSSLKFLRRTPWARTKVENLYLYWQKRKR